MKDVQEQLNEALKRERTSREKAIELLQTHDRVSQGEEGRKLTNSIHQIEEKMKYEYESKIKEQDTILYNLKDENKLLQAK